MVAHSSSIKRPIDRAMTIAESDVDRATGSVGESVCQDEESRNRHWGQWAAEVATGVFVVYFAGRVIRNPAMHWPDIGHFFFSRPILLGLRTTLVLTAVSLVIGVVVGVVLALMRLSRIRLLRLVSVVYIAAFRSTPLLVQILVWYNLASFFRTLSIGIPFTDLHINGDTNSLITPLTASLLALGLNEAAYMAEVVRSGILSVPPGQLEAGMSLGLTRGQAMRHVVLPQTVRVLIPPTVNQLILLLKATALVSVVGGGDLLTRAEYIYAANFLVLPLLFVVTFWYVILTAIATVIQYYVERQLAHDDAPSAGLPRRYGRNLARLRQDTRVAVAGEQL
jgi:polar amino acid transport system permease protein